MTTIDKSKLKRIITQCGSEDEMEMVRAVWSAAQAEEREECASILRKVSKTFCAGLAIIDMTQQKAYIRGWKHAIDSALNDLLKN